MILSKLSLSTSTLESWILFGTMMMVLILTMMLIFNWLLCSLQNTPQILMLKIKIIITHYYQNLF